MADLKGGSRVGGIQIENIVGSQAKADKAFADAKAYADTHIGMSGNAHPTATTGSHGFMSSSDKLKLDGISNNAKKVEASATNGKIKIDGVETTVYTHPATHPATIIVQDTDHRFVTDNEKSSWNNKLDANAKAVDSDKLDGINSSQFLRNDIDNVINGDITFKSAGSVELKLVADTDNVTETDNPSILLSQDNGSTKFRLGLNENNKFYIKNDIADKTLIELGTSGIETSSLDLGESKFYEGGTGFGIYRRYNTDYTIFQIWSPPDSQGAKEATLALVRGDNNEEFLDLYNNGYSSETQFGIRMQKRSTGQYRDFVFDYYDGTTKTEVLRIKPDGSLLQGGTNQIWHTGNDGSGSGLDADTVDGIQGSQILRNDQSQTLTGNLTVTGNVTVNSELNVDSIISFNNPTSGNKDHIWYDDGGSFGGIGNFIFVADGNHVQDGNAGLRFGHLWASNSSASNYIAGKLGIGVSSPATKLDVSPSADINFKVGNPAGYGIAEIKVLDTVGDNISFLNLHRGNQRAWQFGISGRDLVITSTGGSSNTALANTSKFRINDNGNVGIGTSSPSYKLHVAGQGYFQPNGTIGGITPANGGIVIDDGSYILGIDVNEIVTTFDLNLTTLNNNRIYFRPNNNLSLELFTDKSAVFHGIIKTSKSTYQVTFAAGEDRKTITHNYGTTNYMCTFGANSVARHIAWENKGSNTIDVILDSPYYDDSIVVDVIILGY